MKLHDKQIRLLKLLTDNQGDPLTIREIQEKLDLSSTSLVHHHITMLEKKGYLKRNPSKMLHFPVEEAFMVKATGDSMEPKIHDGDIVIAKKQNIADEGQIVICSLDSSVMIKRFSGKKDVILESLNNKYFPIMVNKDQSFNIEGVMKGLICFHEGIV